MLNTEEFRDFVESEERSLREHVIEDLKKITLKKILQRKNPYLLCSRGFLTAHDLIKDLIDAYCHESYETRFGHVLENIARFVANKIYGATKSDMKGLDFDLLKIRVRYILEIKSGPHWGNSSSHRDLNASFLSAKAILDPQDVVGILGICYGRTPHSADTTHPAYTELCGKEFWALISGDDAFYRSDIMLNAFILGAAEHNAALNTACADIINKLSETFSLTHCHADGSINFVSITEFISSK